MQAKAYAGSVVVTSLGRVNVLYIPDAIICESNAVAINKRLLEGMWINYS